MGFGILSPPEGDKYKKLYYTTSDFEYCNISGTFQSCTRCSWYENYECTISAQTVSHEFVNKFISSFPHWEEEDKIIVDATEV